MQLTNRRGLLKQGSLAAAGIAALAGPSATALGANERVTVGLIGCGSHGRRVARALDEHSGAKVTYVCDPDEGRREYAYDEVHADHAVADFRKILDDKSVDAVVIAAPNHWHTPASLLALDAGKHVYVEKLCSHNIREGRLLVEAVRRTGRVLQHGTPCRSSPTIVQAVELLRDGLIGDVLSAKAWNIQRRASIGHGTPEDPPAGIDYDLWLGPAPYVPFQSNRLHGGWHWWYDFGAGGMGNDGAHDVDYALMGLGVQTHPSSVAALGGKFVFDDDQQFPDTQTVYCEYPGDGKVGDKRMFIYEQRFWSTNRPHDVDSGVEFYGTQGRMFLSRRGKVQVLGERNKPVKVEIPLVGHRDQEHVDDFVGAIRGGRRPHAGVEIAHRTSTVVHLGNIAARLGRSLQFDPKTEQIIGDEEAAWLTRRRYREGHWAVPQGV